MNKLGKRTRIERRGLLLVLSSPSGAGKTTLSRRILESDPSISMSVSVTTRRERPGEVDGVDYQFIDRRRFDAMATAGELVEWAEVFGNGYGTPRAPVEKALSEGRDMLFDIDWQGSQQLSQAFTHDVVRVFILPPSVEALRQRLLARAQDSSTVVAKRMAAAENEIVHWSEYDYVIVNDDVEESGRAIEAILVAERLKRERRTGLTAFVRGLLKEL